MVFYRSREDSTVGVLRQVAIAPRRDAQHGERFVAQLVDEELAFRSGEVAAQVTLSVAHDKTLAKEFGSQRGHGSRHGLEAADALEFEVGAFSAHQEPL